MIFHTYFNLFNLTNHILVWNRWKPPKFNSKFNFWIYITHQQVSHFPKVIKTSCWTATTLPWWVATCSTALYTKLYLKKTNKYCCSSFWQKNLASKIKCVWVEWCHILVRVSQLDSHYANSKFGLAILTIEITTTTVQLPLSGTTQVSWHQNAHKPIIPALLSLNSSQALPTFPLRPPSLPLGSNIKENPQKQLKQTWRSRQEGDKKPHFLSYHLINY